MSDETFRSVVVFLLSAVVFCLALSAAPAAAFGAPWAQAVADALLYVGLVGMSAGAVLFLLAATSRPQ